MNDWRVRGVETVAAVLEANSFSGLSRSVTVRPTEAAVLIKDGAVIDVFSEGRRSTRSSVEILKSIVGIKNSVEVFIADTTPFNFEFWLEDPSSPASVAERVSFGIPALSKDGKAISAQITIRLSVDSEQIEIFYRMTKGRQVLSRDDVAAEIRDELLGKVIGLELAKHNLEDLRGNRELLEAVQKSLERELASTLHGYGLKLDNFYINWGLTSQELQAFGKARHDAEIEAVQRQQELAELKGQPPIEAPDRGQPSLSEEVRTGGSAVKWVWIAASVLVLLALIGVVIQLTDSASQEPPTAKTQDEPRPMGEPRGENVGVITQPTATPIPTVAAAATVELASRPSVTPTTAALVPATVPVVTNTPVSKPTAPPGTAATSPAATPVLKVQRMPTALPTPTPTPLSGIAVEGAPMLVPKTDFSTTLLHNGKVLVAGGSTPYGKLNSTELFDVSSNEWREIAPMNVARSGTHVLTTLQDGRVLVTGGAESEGEFRAEIYDPTSDSWSMIGGIKNFQWIHTATLLKDGQVLIIAPQPEGASGLAEAFDPTSNEFYEISRPNHPKSGSIAILLDDGRVLTIGSYESHPYHHYAEIFDPTDGTWSELELGCGGDGIGHEGEPYAALLPSGEVLWLTALSPLGDVRLANPPKECWGFFFDPVSGNFRPAGLHNGFWFPRWLPLDNGMILGLSGGKNSAQLGFEFNPYNPEQKQAIKFPPAFSGHSEINIGLSMIEVPDGRVVLMVHHCSRPHCLGLAGKTFVYHPLMVTATPPPTPTPTSAPAVTKGRIAFDSDRDGNREIYVMNADGSGQTRLTNNAAGDYKPAWSPDGAEIAFVSDRDGNREIYVMNADGTGQTRLTNNAARDEHPAWSPDGTEIAFHSNRDGNYEIYVMNADGSGLTRLTNNGAEDYRPAWSPDGAEIAFSSYRDGDAEIYVMNADGTGQTRLTDNDTSDRGPA